ncbi:putative bifunctional diguanylate cyclase/phosphodiesterase [Xylophilus sp. GOD-11R]|uniref:putative bifunctional diguanylate cyclase/phosphodiesterase n=1 Tax=Xylophilus sp. GOD-11R TaxID=3089814 RepID=UPI00298C8A91|nr:EAL domain-containing protein [Xylophilus sp. GOD-11R]WPB58025.1 EAL domain-containing protein [Xylophilus sp. GOD-11R]
MQGRLTASEDFQAEFGLIESLRLAEDSQGSGLPLVALDIEDHGRILFWGRGCVDLTGHDLQSVSEGSDPWSTLLIDRTLRDDLLSRLLTTAAGCVQHEVSNSSKPAKRIAWWPARAPFGGSARCRWFWLTEADERATLASPEPAAAGDALQVLFSHMPDMAYLKDGDGRWLLASPAMRKHLQVSRQPTGFLDAELIGQNHPAADFLRESALHEEAVWLSGVTLRTEEVFIDQQQATRLHDVLRAPSFEEDGRRRHILVVRRDVTELRSASSKLELAGRVLDQSTDGILIADASHRVVMVNAAFTEITGFSQDEALGLNPMVLTAGQQDEALNRAIWQLLETQDEWRGEVWNRRRTGHVFPQRLSLSVLRHRGTGAITHYVAAISDLSSSKAAEERIATLSTLDVVTGLSNRAQAALHATGVLDEARALNEHVALMVLDIDNFKVLNDSLGHDSGDQLLRTVGERITAAAGSNAVIGRLGGDEFLVALPGLRHTAEAAQAARSIMNAVADPVSFAEMPINVSISVGIAMFPGDGDTFDALFRRADAALHVAKRGGRADYQFAMAAMNDASLERLQLESSLRYALDHDSLRLEYQPLVELATGRIVGIEALCRWDDALRGAVPPNVFIPLAEESGMIEQLGGWVLTTAARQLRALHQAGHTQLFVAVNLSARQFQRGVVLAQVENALVLSGIPADKLELELTESVLLHDGEAVMSTLRQLKALGVKLSIDDFGTGYSSFAYLRRFKFDKIKIDQSFVRDLIDDPDNAAIVRGIISLALSLGLDVLAEGVETDAIAQRLRHLRCTFAQGYHFARPLRPDALLERLDC